MKEKKIYRIFMTAAVVVQAVLGIMLAALGLYGELELYTMIDCFFLHFCFVPGVVLLLLLLHFLAFKKYEKPWEFARTSGFMALCLSITGEILVVLYDMIPSTWIPMLIWYILAAVITTAVVYIFNMIFVINYLASARYEQENGNIQK